MDACVEKSEISFSGLQTINSTTEKVSAQHLCKPGPCGTSRWVFRTRGREYVWMYLGTQAFFCCASNKIALATTSSSIICDALLSIPSNPVRVSGTDDWEFSATVTSQQQPRKNSFRPNVPTGMYTQIPLIAL